MRQLFTIFVLLLGCVSGSASEAACGEVFAFDVHQRNYLLSTVFELHSKERFLGSIVKESLNVRTQYDLYNEAGTLQGAGVCRLLTLGVVFSWACEIDVYDQNKELVGVIDGQVATSAAAKFSIYDAAGTRVGIAYLDRTNAAFTIVDPVNELRHLASFRRNFVQNIVDHWDVKVYSDAVDIRLIKVFAGFAIDSQDHFKKDV